MRRGRSAHGATGLNRPAPRCQSHASSASPPSWKYRTNTACGPRESRIVGPVFVARACAPPLSTTSALSTYTHDPSSDVVANVYASSRGAMIQPDHDALNRGTTAPPPAALKAAVDGVSTTVLTGSPLQSTLVK